MEASVEEFISVTGVDEERAKFYLQSANGELHVALETFFDNDHLDSMETESSVAPPNHDVAATRENESASKSSPPVESKKTRQKPSSRIATISNFQDEANSSDEEGQAFYAGGSETSGQQILGPNNKKKNLTKSIFDAARSHGAEEINEGSSSSSAPKQKSLFKGAGFKLGSDVEPSEQVNPFLNPNDKPVEKKDKKIKFWKNGFSIDDGPLRNFSDPENKAFLDAIRRGEVPDELRKQVQSGEVHVNMEDHGEEEFVQPKIKPQAFAGSGYVLGSPVPHVKQEETLPPLASTTVPKHPTFQVDDSKPVTTIQIRLSDGTRLVSKFNHDNTIGDIRRLVANAQPTTGNFKLMTTFPNKILTDDTQTIADAKLLNAVIVQRKI